MGDNNAAAAFRVIPLISADEIPADAMVVYITGPGIPDASWAEELAVAGAIERMLNRAWTAENTESAGD
jgi:hypothetical protein